jgi:hypothetical protein
VNEPVLPPMVHEWQVSLPKPLTDPSACTTILSLAAAMPLSPPEY